MGEGKGWRRAISRLTARRVWVPRRKLRERGSPQPPPRRGDGPSPAVPRAARPSRRPPVCPAPKPPPSWPLSEGE
eukprot:4665871-Alexandrium_andersonii.AAC.1